MAKSIVRFRIEDELKTQATAICENLGIDLPTALRMYMKRIVLMNGIPFSMTLPKKDDNAERAIHAMYSLGEAAKKNGTADMSLDEINAEIAAARAERSPGRAEQT